MTNRTQPAYGLGGPEPSVSEPNRPTVTPDQLGTRLVGIEGLYSGHQFALVGAVSNIGRGSECEVCLMNDATVSRDHARITLEDAGHHLTDLGSSNGTYVNGVLIQACILVPGDVIQCGSSRLRYE
jgi:pSer/pThr/pTyr-binding forkhead associated (FHA) protein